MKRNYNNINCVSTSDKSSVSIKNETAGITLIALVITVIVLLILAGVTIATLTGENGLLTRASEAKDKTNEAAQKEDAILTQMETLLENGYFTKSTTINGGEASSTNQTIPTGFKAVDTETAKWGDGTAAPTQEAVNAGLVIEDAAGNQFVWVPVDGTNVKYEKHTYAVEKVDDTGWKRDEGNGKWPTYHYRNYIDWTDVGGNAESVAKYKGFYVARYEAGVPSNANFYASKDGDEYYTSSTNNDTTPSKNVTTYTPVSKKNNQVWNYISQEKAKEVSCKMYSTGSGVTSSLIDSYAWDTVSTWLSNTGHNVADSTEWGNYYNASFTFDGLYAKHTWDSTNGWKVATEYSKGSYTKPQWERTETATGVSERNKANNIYDFAGNMYEWTTETGKHKTSDEDEGSNTTYAVHCGGSLSGTGVDSASYRNGYDGAVHASFLIGFRVVLYLE